MQNKFVCTKTSPVVETCQGKLRGFWYNGVCAFHGIRYAQAARFEQPTPPPTWTGVRDALAYGHVAPLMEQTEPHDEVMVPHRYWPSDENCQYLNVWTTSLDPEAKKPVLVWLHGGGFFAGSGIEQVAYEGDNMSREGDCVVVTLNHRLNILGYLSLEGYGERYHNSGNAGNADLVAALHWVRHNIAAFGGDPQLVTLFGQSGGGMKIWTLMNTPAADGLYHRAMIQSGVLNDFIRHPDTDNRPIIEALIREMGLPDADALQTVSYPALCEAYRKVSPAVQEAGHYIGGNPVPNDFYLGDPLEVGFSAYARSIPVLIGSVFGEFHFGPNLEDKYHQPKDKLRSMLRSEFGEAAPDLEVLFRQAYPEKCLADLLNYDSEFRVPTLDFVKKLSVCSHAGVYNYLFSYEFPYDDGHVAWHCSEIPYVFHNTSRIPICQEEGVTDRLEAQIFGAVMQFARTGDPNHSALPRWDACSPTHIYTMLWDRECRQCADFDLELSSLHSKHAPKFIDSVKMKEILY